MTDYVKFTNFTVKDSLPTGDTNKVIRGAEFDTEFDAIATAVTTKSNIAGPTFTGTATFDGLTATGTVNFSGATVSNLGSVTTVDINGGSIDGAVIGGSTPAAVSGTTGTFSGAVSGTTGTFSGAVTGSNLNISNWDTAFGWGDHSTEGYLTNVTFSDINAGAITTSGETFANSDTQIPTNAAVRNWVLTTYPTIVELNDLTANVTWATVPDAYISASSVDQHVSVEKATQTKTYTNGELSTITLSSAVSSGAPVVSVIKEVPQTGVTNNAWDAAAGSYTLENSAYATSLSFAGDLSSASFVDSFSIASQETSPRGLAFSTDGTKMFVLGTSGDDVNEYTLSTGFDVSTASFVDSFSISSQEDNPWGLAFNNDGTKMFVTGLTGVDVNEYDLSTAFDVSTASYSQNFSISSETATPRGITFSSNGSKMFIADYSASSIDEYDLSTGFDVSTSVYSQTFSVSSQATQPLDVSFNSSGTKMFVVGNNSDSVHEYALSTGFDISTASFVESLSVASEETNPSSLAFNADGSKMFVVGYAGDDVNEYSLPLTLQLGTGSFASTDVGKTINVNDGVLILTATDGSYVETTAPTSTDTAASGEWSMFGVVYDATADVLKISGGLLGVFDISTAVYSQNFSVSAQDTLPKDLAFNTDGTKMYVLGDTGNDVNEYDLSTGFDVSTAVLSNVLSTSYETTPGGMTFNTDGTKLYVVGSTQDDVHTYNLSTGFDTATAVYSGASDFYVGGQDTTPTGIAFNTDGTKMFITGSSGDNVYEYNLSVGFDTTTSVYSQNFSLSEDGISTNGIAFNPDGTQMFIVGNGTDSVYQYNLSTGFDVSTAVYTGVFFDVSSQETVPQGIAFNADGSKMFVIGSASDAVNEYTISTTAARATGYQPAISSNIDSTYWTDINSLTATNAVGDGNVFYAVSNDARDSWSVLDNTSGTRDIVRNNAGTWQYNSNATYGSETWVNATTNTEVAALREAMTSSQPFQLSASTQIHGLDISSYELEPQGLFVKDDGTEIYISAGAGLGVDQFTLSTAFDLTTASHTAFQSTSSQGNNPRGVFFKPDGTKMYEVQALSQDVKQYSLSTAWDITTLSYDSVAFVTSGQVTNLREVTFKSDGTKMYVVGSGSSIVAEYDLSTSWDISTASYNSVSYDFSSQVAGAESLSIQNDGTTMLIGQNALYKYTLSTAWDITTASFVETFDAGSGPFMGAMFGDGGEKLYYTQASGTQGDTIQEYTATAVLPLTANQMDSTKLNAITDANQITLGNDLDFAAILYIDSGTTVPTYSGTAINYDANVINQGAVLGTDYNWDFPATDKVRLTSLGDYNLKVRII